MHLFNMGVWSHRDHDHDRGWDDDYDDDGGWRWRHHRRHHHWD